MSIILKPVGVPPELRPGDPDLATMQKFVGGYIEMVRMTLPAPKGLNPKAVVPVACWVNEEGLLLNLPKNFLAGQYTAAWLIEEAIRGPAVFTGMESPTGRTRSLSENQVAAVLAIFGIASPVKAGVKA